jgi:D-sedoheptulose 7-phosphate isomerase
VIELTRLLTGREHLEALRAPLAALEAELDKIDAWGRRLAGILAAGGRLLAVGNGGSAAQAQHLTAELVGRYRSDRRPPLSALALHAETSSYTAIANDFGADEAFARQVRAHGRPGDVLLALSTSGYSSNVVAALEAAVDGDLVTWAVTGRAPNPVCEVAEEAVCVDSDYPPSIQEIHQIVVHLLCASVEEELLRR